MAEKNTKTSLFFLDVEDGVLYELKPKFQKTLLRSHPNWYKYGVEDGERLKEVERHFKQKGKVVACQRDKNLFFGFLI